MATDFVTAAADCGLFMFDLADGTTVGIGTKEEADQLVNDGIFEALTLRAATAEDFSA